MGTDQENTSGTGSDSKEERVARITARQTILVTIITVCGALGGALIQRVAGRAETKTSEPAVLQDWFTVENVELLNRLPGQMPAQIRLVATVNNSTKYSYPSPVLWEPVQGDLPDESFPLPIRSAPYSVSFIMYLDDGDDDITSFHSQETLQIDRSPHKSEAKLVGFTPGTRATGLTQIQARVRFRIDSK